jgi:putative ubiquitin-RnfH superfamily antitoxin RatB of RatAB toxin-antitoxin module
MLKITVVWAPEPRSTQILELMLPQGATLADAKSKLISAVPEAMAPEFILGSEASRYAASIWGKFKSLETLLKEGDRIELTRGLRVDPKEARRQPKRESLSSLLRQKGKKPKSQKANTTKRQKDKKAKRQNDKKTKRQKGRMAKRQKG